ncbi:MAG TPA: DNA primase [Kofleriaceae bacterium]|jgi:DNA primase
MIADEIISEIRSRADIVAVIGQHVQLKKAGRSWKGLCPFHGEKTPSFNVMPDKGFFHCFGCQKHGDVFTFVMEIEGKTFVEAAEQLGNRFGVAVPKIEESPEARRARGERVAMLDINKLATQFFREILADDKKGEPGRAYLAKRGVGDATATAFQLGYAPSDWHALADYLKEKRADLELAAKLGLVAKQPRAGGYYDRYRDRLVCPVIVPGGDVVGFSARVIASAPPGTDASDAPPKYINSPESIVYKKSRLLFGLAQAREGMQKLSRAVLVEGNFDVITLHQAEFTEVIAPLGTALTLEQVQMLKRLTPCIVLLYDGDKAGYNATMHALQTCVEADIEVKVASRPGNARSGGAGMLAGGVDPDSLVASGGAAQLREAIERARPGIEFFCYEVWGKAKANADARTRAIEHAAQLAVKIDNPIKRELVVDTLAKGLEVDPGLVRSALARAGGGDHGRGRSMEPPRQSHPNAPNASTAAPSSNPPATKIAPMEEIELVKLMLDHPSLIASPDADKAFWLLTDDSLQAMYREARAGTPLIDLVSQSPIAKHVLSGKQTEAKDPHAKLLAMIDGFEQRRQLVDRARDLRALVDAKRGTQDQDEVRLQTQLAVAKKKGDQQLVEQLAAQISSTRKQAE